MNTAAISIHNTLYLAYEYSRKFNTKYSVFGLWIQPQIQYEILCIRPMNTAANSIQNTLHLAYEYNCNFGLWIQSQIQYKILCFRAMNTAANSIQETLYLSYEYNCNFDTKYTIFVLWIQLQLYLEPRDSIFGLLLQLQFWCKNYHLLKCETSI